MELLSSLSVLIPAYRDESTIADAVMRSRDVARAVSRRFEIIVINDASPDGTGPVLAGLKKRIPALTVITHERNRGYGATIRELYYAGSADWLYTTPGDMQVDPSELLRLVPFGPQSDMVIGWRTSRADTPSRVRQSAIYNGLVRLLYGTPFHDVNSVRLIRKRALPPRLWSSEAFVDAELAIRMWRAGARIAEVPISHRPRTSGTGGGGKFSVIWPTFTDMLAFRMFGHA